MGTENRPMISFFRSVREDVAAVFASDPAARSYFEVVILYPGLQAVWAHHMSHWLWRHHMRFLARFFSQVARLFTGIEIHPGAEIGKAPLHRPWHGHGDRRDRHRRRRRHALSGSDSGRHRQGERQAPSHVGNNVSIGSGAKLLGNITIGDNCRVGAGSVVLRSVPANSTIVGVPGHIVLRDGKRVVITDPKDIRDPLSDVIIRLADRGA